jgi:type II secretory pathway component PulF
VAKTRVKVVDRGAAKLLRETKAMQAAAVRVGILGSDATEAKRRKLRRRTRSGPPRSTTTDVNVATVAAAHELGLGVPLRSWLRTPIDALRPEIQKQMKKLAQQVERGLPLENALDRLGLWLVGKLQKGIAAGLPVPPLAPATVAKKGSSKPLIDTGQMRSSISHEVVGR